MEVGKKWTWDSLSLRVPSAGDGFIAIFLAVDSNSKKKFACGMLGQSADDYIQAHNALRAFTRPYHGEIFIVNIQVPGQPPTSLVLVFALPWALGLPGAAKRRGSLEELPAAGQQQQQ